MTKPQFSPGPWKARANTRGGKPTGCYYVETKSDGFATSVICENAASGDACLIAAAPELMESLEAAERFISGFEDDELQQGVAELLTKIRASTAKAKGLAA